MNFIGLNVLCVCVFTTVSLFVLRIVILYLVYFLSVTVWLSVGLPEQSIAWKDSSPKWPIMCRVWR